MAELCHYPLVYLLDLISVWNSSLSCIFSTLCSMNQKREREKSNDKFRYVHCSLYSKKLHRETECAHVRAGWTCVTEPESQVLSNDAV
jgi:hypothetical protein